MKTYTNNKLCSRRVPVRRAWVFSGVLIALCFALVSPAAVAREAPEQAESAGFSELRRALEGFIVILALEPTSGEMLKVRSEPGGVEIIRPLVYLDVEAAYVDWLGGTIPQAHAVVAANAVDVIIETQGAAVWVVGDFDASKAQVAIDQPALFYVETADEQPILQAFGDGQRMPMFVSYNDAARLLDKARQSMTSPDGTPIELKIGQSDMMGTLQTIISGQISGVRLVSPGANLRWAEENQRGLKTLDGYITDADLAARELIGE